MKINLIQLSGIASLKTGKVKGCRCDSCIVLRGS